MTASSVTTQSKISSVYKMDIAYAVGDDRSFVILDVKRTCGSNKVIITQVKHCLDP